jgi:pentatricopeptide repeat protein
MLERARRLGISPNVVMVNTAISALGKAGRPADAAALFAAHPAPDAVAYETLIAAHGLAGDPAAAEAAFEAMRAAGHTPRDYAYTALVRDVFRTPAGMPSADDSVCWETNTLP